MISAAFWLGTSSAGQAYDAKRYAVDPDQDGIYLPANAVQSPPRAWDSKPVEDRPADVYLKPLDDGSGKETKGGLAKSGIAVKARAGAGPSGTATIGPAARVVAVATILALIAAVGLLAWAVVRQRGRRARRREAPPILAHGLQQGAFQTPQTQPPAEESIRRRAA
jgi:hypothetical protein